MSQKSSRPQHDRSRRIKDFENNNLIQLIEREDGVTLATAAVQLWLSQKPSHTTWTKHHTGVICFVKDYTKKSYFFRLYSLVPHQLWEQEMYTPFSYNQLTKQFHYFASDDCNAGFNFAFEEEAEKFYNIVMNKIMSKTRRNTTRAVNGTDAPRTNGQHSNQQQSVNNTNSVSQLSNSANSVNSNLNHSGNNFNSNNKSSTPISLSSATSSLTNKFSTLKKNKKFDKTQIGAPTNFRIVQHVGLTNNDYEINVTAKDESLKMRDILSAISIQGVPMNKKTETFINNYIRNNGGMERFDEELKKQKAPAPPPVLPTTPANNNNHYPKPIQQQQHQQHTRPAPTPNMNRTSNAPSVPPPPPPPPPPPMPAQQQQQHQQQQQQQNYTPTQLTYTPTQTQPPPPPPLPAMNKPNGSFPTPKMEPVITSMNSVNINQQSSGAPPPPPPPPPPMNFFSQNTTPVVIQKSAPKQTIEPPKPNPHDDLLNSIKNSGGLKSLKPVGASNPSRESGSSPDVPASAAPEGNSIIDQLKNELMLRAKFLNDSDEDDEESDSEWQ